MSQKVVSDPGYTLTLIQQFSTHQPAVKCACLNFMTGVGRSETFQPCRQVQIPCANSVDPDETAHNEPSHQDLHGLHRCPVRSVGLKGLISYHI